MVISACCEQQDNNLTPKTTDLIENKSPIKPAAPNTETTTEKSIKTQANITSVEKPNEKPLQIKASSLKADIEKNRQENNELKRKIDQLTKKAIEHRKILEQQ